ncbi:MAG TPA: serine hydrolase domain-containing protein [Candidatus Binataceae bacterium]|nr:serine hydrolase domain-containing protein [Candidatus Binataceae bacterium]
MSNGFSKSRLARVREVMRGHVDNGNVPGLVTLLCRHGEVHIDAVGMKTLGGSDPMGRDTIFRITSMTKPITAVAAMILVEECRLRLDEPVDKFLPELANRRVLRRIDGPLDDTVAASRPITLRDLLTFRMGLGAIFAPSNQYPILKAIKELQITGFGPPDQATPIDPDEWLRRLGTLPLMHQPGERWMYNVGSSVLGVLIARASGQQLETFMRERIFDPLGMKDTSFSVPPAKLDRLAASYWISPRSGALELVDGIDDSKWNRPPAFHDGAAGLVSTVDDYYAFARMMLNKGGCDSGRILSRPSVELMTADQLTPQQKAVSGLTPGQFETRGWGFAMMIVTARDELWAVPGRYGWDGGFGTSWANDPREDTIAILMTQRGEYPAFSPVYQDFWTLAYQALDD